MNALGEYNFIILGKSKLLKGRYKTFDYLNIQNILVTRNNK